MSRKYLWFSFCLVLLTLLAGAPLPSDESSPVLTDRLLSALENEGPWTVWVYFRDKGLEGSALEMLWRPRKRISIPARPAAEPKSFPGASGWSMKEICPFTRNT